MKYDLAFWSRDSRSHVTCHRTCNSFIFTTNINYQLIRSQLLCVCRFIFLMPGTESGAAKRKRKRLREQADARGRRTLFQFPNVVPTPPTPPVVVATTPPVAPTIRAAQRKGRTQFGPPRKGPIKVFYSSCQYFNIYQLPRPLQHGPPLARFLGIFRSFNAQIMARPNKGPLTIWAAQK